MCPIRPGHVAVDYGGPDELATFWEDTLDGERVELPAGTEEAMGDPGETGVAMLFKPMEKESTRQMPIHPDLGTDDRAADVERLRKLGASVRETKTGETGDHTATWTITEGNGFCVFGY